MDGGDLGGGGGPAPFLLKTYDMVDDASTDDIVSWSSTNSSFVVWDPSDFAARLLPTYFKHNNFSSFIRQLNTYGFRKIDPERWEFANDDFIKGQKHRLKNIHRRKPIHSHSHPPGGGLADAERAAMEEAIERLNREKADLEANLGKFKQQQSGAGIQMDDLERRMADMEQRQLKMVAFMQRAMKNPRLMRSLLKMALAASMDISVIHKKRRLPPDLDYCQEASVNILCDNDSSTAKPENGCALDRDFCDKLKLELWSAIPDNNLVNVDAQCSNEDNGSLQAKQTDCGQELMECLPLIPETSQLCDTEAPTCPTKNSLFVKDFEEGDGLFPCHLNLTLASSVIQIDSSKNSSRSPELVDQGSANTTDCGTADATDPKTNNTMMDNDPSTSIGTKRRTTGDSADARAVDSQEVLPTSNETLTVLTGANDVFWQQFLTERPGSYDTEEASCCSRVNTNDEQNEESMPGNDNMWKSKKVVGSN